MLKYTLLLSLAAGLSAAEAQRNLWVEVLGLTPAAVTERINATYTQLFNGNAADERIYFPVGEDAGYIIDVANDDIRSEGLSYGMMIAVQLDQREVFDRLWTWAKKVHRIPTGPRAGSFGWHAKADGTLLSQTAAPDGEEWFVTALFFAAARWSEPRYRAEAEAVLHMMRTLGQGEGKGVGEGKGDAEVRPQFHHEHHMVVFTPKATGYLFTDPSYHVPAFYTIWAAWSQDPAYWSTAADVSRAYLHRACHPQTGLTADYAHFDGTPYVRKGHEEFRADAWRVAMNVSLDWAWWRADPWQPQQSDRWLAFFRGPGADGMHFTWDGTMTAGGRTPGLRMMIATANVAATTPDRASLQAAWDQPTPRGHGRYYDGLLHLLGLLVVSGDFRYWLPPKP